MRRYLWPCAALGPYISHYTLYTPQESESAARALNIIPDASGCLVFTIAPGEIRSVFWGATTRATPVPRDALRRLLIEFLPGGARRLLNLPHRELVDCCVPLEALLPKLRAAILECIFRATSDIELKMSLDGVFLRLLAQRPDDHPLFGALQALRRRRGPVPTIARLADESCYSERHLSRVAADQLGLGLKAYLRILRVNHVLDTLGAHDGLTSPALANGYFDQAHFIHDFKAICGTTPREFLRNKSDFYNEPYKF